MRRAGRPVVARLWPLARPNAPGWPFLSSRSARQRGGWGHALDLKRVNSDQPVPPGTTTVGSAAARRCVKAVYLGSRMDPAKAKEISTIMAGTPAELYQTELHSRDFGLVFRRTKMTA